MYLPQKINALYAKRQLHLKLLKSNQRLSHFFYLNHRQRKPISFELARRVFLILILEITIAYLMCVRSEPVFAYISFQFNWRQQVV